MMRNLHRVCDIAVSHTAFASQQAFRSTVIVSVPIAQGSPHLGFIPLYPLSHDTLQQNDTIPAVQ